MKRQPLRNMIQAIFFVITLGLIYMIYTGILMLAHQVCPNAAICFGVEGLKSGNYAFLPAVIAGLVILISTMFTGRYFCSYVCFFGTIQEFKYRLFRKKKRITPKISVLYEQKLNVVKYIVLAFTIISILFFSIRLYQNLCPAMVITTLNQITWQSIVIIIIFTVVAYFSSRFWCRFLCPFGALMNVFQYFGNLFKIKRLKIQRNMEVCIDCHLCDKVCPMNINISEVEIVQDPNCIHCGECITRCPKKNALLENIPK
ncbi:MAG: 4Fe-4S binding protein [Candidatus Cloacimonetes bacterium]|nr:4Fe-4S binding protein [Candidatus Cloacimonadota bacterium]